MRSKILLRLLKQSAIPALAALCYVVIRHWPWGGDAKLPALFESFVAAFFLVSWFSGQILRTAKQVHDEERFNTILEKLDGIEKLNGFDTKSLEALKGATIDHINLAADYAHLRSAVKMLVPDYIKGMVFAMHIDRGDDSDLSYVKPWEVSEGALAAARHELHAATERARDAQV